MNIALPCLEPAAKGKIIGICRLRYPGKPVGEFTCTTCSENPNGVTIAIAAKKQVMLPPEPVEPLPPELQEVEAIAHEADPTLLGNRIEAWAQQTGLDKAAALFERWTGIPCGCPWRKKVANLMHEKLRSLTGVVHA